MASLNVSLVIDGQERLCLRTASNNFLKNFSYNEIHNSAWRWASRACSARRCSWRSCAPGHAHLLAPLRHDHQARLSACVVSGETGCPSCRTTSPSMFRTSAPGVAAAASSRALTARAPSASNVLSQHVPLSPKCSSSTHRPTPSTRSRIAANFNS